MKESSQSNQNKRLQSLIIAIAITAIAVIGLFFLRENVTANITISPTNHAGQVFIDQQEAGQFSANTTTTIPTGAGSKEILINGNDTYPWKEVVSVSSGSTTMVTPFLIPQQPQRIANVPQEVTQQLNAVAGNPPTSATTSDDSIEVVVTEDGRLGARWQAGASSAPSYFTCSDGSCEAIIYDNDSRSARQVGQYPEHSNAIIFATDNGVYALEIDPSGDTQNFQPINQNLTNPEFVIANNNIFVRSGDQVTATQL